MQVRTMGTRSRCGASPATTPSRRSPTPSWPGAPPASRTSCGRSAQPWGPGVHLARALSRALHHGAGHAEDHQRAVPALLRVRARPSRAAAASRRRPGPGHHRGPVPAEGGRAPGVAARAPACAHRWAGRRGVARHRLLRRADVRRPGHLHHPADLARGHGPTALHQRNHWHPQRCDPRPRGGGRPLRHGCVRTRSAPRGRVLVHRRPRLGHRHVVQHHRPARPGRDSGRRRRRLRHPALVPDPRRATGQCLVHRAHGPADADARPPPAKARTTCRARATCPPCASSPPSANPPTPRPWCGARTSSNQPGT